ncbi:hypothetical protein RRG08_061513 [Elysia crispata]|uniref:EGF-like domain-containing protein n=1 Tax=Elysia crispata TaxID=231223 RepID=A0AAE0Y378_9GAST|nr:hypothetical protein RRG08_061513 [Elysia crispata]
MVFLFTACGNSTFGENCLKRCSIGCSGKIQTCDKVNGTCLYGCKVGYLGDNCNKTSPTDEFASSFEYLAETITALSAFLLVTCLVIGMVAFSITDKRDAGEESVKPKPTTEPEEPSKGKFSQNNLAEPIESLEFIGRFDSVQISTRHFHVGTSVEDF